MRLGVPLRIFALALALVVVFAAVAGWRLEESSRDLLSSAAAPEALAHALHVEMFTSALWGLLAAAVVAGAASALLSRQLRLLLEQVRALAQSRSGAEEDSVRGLLGSFQRLTNDLSQAVSDLTGERNRLSAVLGGLRDAVVALDARGRITLVNPAAKRMMGAATAPEGRTVLETLRAPDLPGLVAEALVGRPATAEFDLRVGRVLRVQAAATPQAGGGCVITLRDVSDLRRLETVRRDFVANVSHELRTPVSALRASAEALSSGAMEDPEAAAAFLNAIERNAERLSALIDDLLSLSRIEAGAYTLNLDRVSLADAVESASAAVSPRATAQGQVISLDLPEELTARADPHALDQVLTNLLDNAVKYTPEGGHIAVRARPDGAHVRIEVEDDGPGVPPHHRERLFERFYRVDPGRSRAIGGTGLGLAIVKHLVEAMGGSVGMRPGEHAGSVFWVVLPGGDQKGSSANR